MKNKFLSVAVRLFSIIAAISICACSEGPNNSTQERGSRDHTMTEDERAKLSPQDIIQLAKDGNKRFLSGDAQVRDFLHDQTKTAGGQYPYGVVLSCIDSRVPASVVFDSGIGDVFNARVAGNFVNTDIAGSLEFGCKVAGSKVIMVMGHTRCGAISGACDGVELGNITSMLANIKPAVDAVQDVEGERNSSNGKFVEAVAINNVKMTVKKIKEISPILKGMADNNEIVIIGCMYDLETGEVKFYEEGK